MLTSPTVQLTPLRFPFPLPRFGPCRSILEQYPAFRPSILGKLLANFSTIQSGAVLGVASWYAPPLPLHFPHTPPHPPSSNLTLPSLPFPQDPGRVCGGA